MLDRGAHLLAVYDVPLLRLLITIQYITCLEVSLAVITFGICFGVVEVSPYHGRPSYTALSSYVIVGYVVSGIVDQPERFQHHDRSISISSGGFTTYFTSVLGRNLDPTEPVSSLSG